MSTPTLELELTTAAGADLNDTVRVELFGAASSNHYDNRVEAVRRVRLEGIAPGLYRVAVTPSNYRLVQFFVTLQYGRTETRAVACPVDPARVAGLRAPAFEAIAAAARRILLASRIPRFTTPDGEYIQGEPLYSAFAENPRIQACFLNIVAKSAATALLDGASCLDHLEAMIRVEQDRVFFRTTAALREEVAASPLFHSVSAALHDPVPGYRIVDSYKTFDRYGNLQLTFQRRGDSGDDYVADVDIDDAQGIEHIFQVIRNSIAGPTNPFDIHDILIADQKLDPGYGFVFAKAAAAG